MEQLRWIILAAGVIFIALIYLIGRNKNKDTVKRSSAVQEFDDLPSISTDETAEEYYGEKKSAPYKADTLLSSGVTQVEINQELIEEIAANVDDGLVDALTYAHAHKNLNKDISDKTPSLEQPAQDDDITEPDTTSGRSETEVTAQPEDDLIILHVLTTSAYFTGDQLAQFINHQQLKFGEMKLYHARDEQNAIVFSMSNMIEPGYFEPEHLSEMQTPGVIFFMQLSLVNDTVAGFKRMQYAAESLAQDLQGSICDAKRRVLSEDDFEQLHYKAQLFQK